MLNRRLSNIKGERWLKEEDEEAGKGGVRVGIEESNSDANKESPILAKNVSRFSDPINILNLRNNLGASKFDKNNDIMADNYVPNFEEGLELIDERKRRRSELHDRGKRASIVIASQAQIQRMEIDNLGKAQDVFQPANVIIICLNAKQSDSTVESDPKKGNWQALVFRHA